MINCTNRNPVTNVVEFIVDSASDISNLPTNASSGENGEESCAMGSSALVIATGDLYLLSGDDTWTKM